MQEFIHQEALPFILQEYSQKNKVIFISQSHNILEELTHNLEFLGVDVTILAPRFSFFTNHEGLNDFTFLKNYIKSFESQAKVTLIHSSLLFFPLPEPDSFTRMTLTKGQSISIVEIAKKLVEMGYNSTSTVYNPAEFSMRGYILDFATTNEAIRIEFSGNKIEEIKQFDCETQKSVKTVGTTDISPNRLITNFDIAAFKARYKINLQEENEQLFHAIEHHHESCDINKYSKLLHTNTLNIMAILSGSIFLHNFTIEGLVHSMQKEFEMFVKQSGLITDALYYKDPSHLLEKSQIIACV